MPATAAPAILHPPPNRGPPRRSWRRRPFGGPPGCRSHGGSRTAQALAGADILLIPTAVPVAEEGIVGLGEAWRYSASLTSTLQVPARALESGVAIAYANHCGPGFTGRSCIATPFGRHAVLLGDSEDVAVARIPLDAVRHARAVNTYGPDLARG
ncbi:nitrilase-related carbon-nitrogen hydrolase [Microbacterium aurantiacum]|uniref:nitrilase-related carbon-nitrogen hydrolase n=1 Tax=Microbacterium aurantiacum TaxID=162393 RepID=UPI00403673C8